MKNKNNLQIKKYGVRHAPPTFCDASGVSVFPYGEHNESARITILTLNALRTFFEDNISTTEMIEIVDNNGKLIFDGSFEELCNKLRK